MKFIYDVYISGRNGTEDDEWYYIQSFENEFEAKEKKMELKYPKNYGRPAKIERVEIE